MHVILVLNLGVSIEEVNQFSHFLKFSSIILVYAFSQI